MQIEIVQDIKTFKALEPEWNMLLSESGQSNIFLTFDWVFSYWSNVKRDCPLFIILIKKNNKLAGIAPLILTSCFGFRQLRFIGAGLADYEDVIARQEGGERDELINGLLGALSRAKGWDILRLRCLRQSSPNYASLRNAAEKENDLSIEFERHKEGALYIETLSGWEKYYASLAKKFIADTKRQRSRLFKDNNNYITEKVKDKRELKDLLNKLTEFHIARRKLQKTRSVLEDEAIHTFLEEIVCKFFEKDMLDFSVIRYKESIAAMHLGFRHQGKFYYYMPVFNEEFQPYSIGRLLLFDLIQQSFNDGVREFDLMLGEETYKYDWRPKLAPLYSLNVYPKTISGGFANQCLNRLNVRIKKLLGKKW